jgi:hypothetical protein
MRSILRFRYLMGMKHCPPGLRCDMQHKRSGSEEYCYPALDKFGLHIINGCPKSRYNRNSIHTAICIELDRLLKFAGLWTTRELHAFIGDLPENKKRPDITIRNTTGLDVAEEVIHIDATVTCTVQGSGTCSLVPPSVNLARTKGHRAEKAYKGKMKKYQDILDETREANPENITATDPLIIPFVFESTGFIHEKSLDFLQREADLANQTSKLGRENTMTFFLRRLSFCFQRAIGSTINLRVREILGRGNFQNDRSFQDSVIVDDGIW